MPRFEVIIKEIEIYVVKVEAENEDDACEKAWEKLDAEGRAEFHNYSDGESEALEIDE